jgi:hypothetical protein
MYATKTVLHLLITALLVVPAVCCGGALQSVPQMQSPEMLGDCPGHAQRGEPVSQQEGCSGCALTEATVNSADASAEEHVSADLPDFPVGILNSFSLSSFVDADVGPAVAIRRHGAWGRPDTPVTLFDRLLLPS